MVMIRVYRIEKEDGTGVYTTGGVTAAERALIERISDYGGFCDDGWSPSSRHPAPGIDRKLGPVWAKTPADLRRRYYFGFKDIAQLQHWFFDIRLNNELTAMGFRVSVYGIEEHDVIEGEHQVAFVKAHATLLDRVGL